MLHTQHNTEHSTTERICPLTHLTLIVFGFCSMLPLLTCLCIFSATQRSHSDSALVIYAEMLTKCVSAGLGGRTRTAYFYVSISVPCSQPTPRPNKSNALALRTYAFQSHNINTNCVRYLVIGYW